MFLCNWIIWFFLLIFIFLIWRTMIRQPQFYYKDHFLKLSKIEIDVHSCILTMEFNGEIVKFNIYDIMKFPNDDKSCLFSWCDWFFSKWSFYGKDEWKVAISEHLENENDELTRSSELRQMIAALNDHPQFQ